MTQIQEAGFDPRAFRRALGNFATGVTIMTAAVGDKRVGVTANSFNSVSLDPALILWSIDKRSTSYDIFHEASHFAVNILAADQIDVSNQFARPKDDKYAGVEYETGFGGAPLLNDCAARFQCERYQIVEGGDHWILIGKVVAFDDFGRSPLLYHQGAYSMVLPHTRMRRKDEEPRPESAFQGRLADNIYYLMTQAVRCYQSSYQPRQLSTGLRTSEARMLMVLENDSSLSMAHLQREVDVPMREIEEAVDILMRKGMVANADSTYTLTGAGRELTEDLWEISREQQSSVFGQFSDDEVKNFKKVLRQLIASC